MLSNDIVITGDRAIARSYAKINLTLDVLKKRDDGYHDIETIMQTVSLFDLLIIDKSWYGISITTNLKYLPNNDKNIAYKAAAEFFKQTGIRGGVRIMIHKNIPVAAGLAGGSGNCAAVLAALNKLYNAGLSHKELCRMGAKLGADVPYCLTGGTQLAAGIGEILTPLPPMPGSAIVLLVKPPINISTAQIYEKMDNAAVQRRPDTQLMKEALSKRDIREISKNLCNVMESVTEEINPVVRGIKEKMIKNGAIGAVMSGSGPTVFGFFDNYKTAKLSHDSFAHQYKDVFLVNTVTI